MSTVAVEIPLPLQEKLDVIAKRSGLSVSQLLADVAEKVSQAEELEQIRQRALQRDTRSGFERVLAAVPDVPPSRPDDVIE